MLLKQYSLRVTPCCRGEMSEPETCCTQPDSLAKEGRCFVRQWSFVPVSCLHSNRTTRINEQKRYSCKILELKDVQLAGREGSQRHQGGSTRDQSL